MYSSVSSIMPGSISMNSRGYSYLQYPKFNIASLTLCNPLGPYIISFSSLPCSPRDCMSPGRPKIWSP